MYVTAALKGNLQPISNHIRVNEEGKEKEKQMQKEKLSFTFFIFLQKLWEIKFHKICKIIERERRKSLY